MIKSIKKYTITYYYVHIPSEYPSMWRTTSGEEWEADFGTCWEYMDPPKDVIDEFKELLIEADEYYSSRS